MAIKMRSKRAKARTTTLRSVKQTRVFVGGPEGCGCGCGFFFVDTRFRVDADVEKPEATDERR